MGVWHAAPEQSLYRQWAEVVSRPVVQAQLVEAYKAYQTSLGLNRDGFGPITPENMEEYLVQYYLIPSANRYLSALSAEEIAAYTAKNPWLTWDGQTASFSFRDFAAHCGRMKAFRPSTTSR